MREIKEEKQDKESLNEKLSEIYKLVSYYLSLVLVELKLNSSKIFGLIHFSILSMPEDFIK